MNMPYAVFLPFCCLLVCSALIIYSMSILRKRIARSSNNSQSNRRREKRDMDYAKTILFMDIAFLFFFFPYTFLLIIGNYFEYNSDAAIVLFYIYYIGYGSDFFIYLIANKAFRAEIFSIFKKSEILTNQP